MPSARRTRAAAGDSRPVDISQLEEMVRVFIDSSIAPATAQVYATSQRRYLAFCRSSRLTPLPTSEHQLCLYVAHLASGGLQHSSIKGYLSAVRRLQIVCGMGDPFAVSWPLLECTLKGGETGTGEEGCHSPTAETTCYSCNLEAVEAILGARAA